MRAAKRIGKVLRLLLYCVLGVALLVALLPIWFPWVLRPVARAYGFGFGGYQRESYGRFAASAVTYSNRTVQFSADRVEADIPTVWLWKRSRREAFAPLIEITNWKLQIASQAAATTNKPPTSVQRVFRQTERVLYSVANWIPRGSATNGSIYTDTGGEILEVRDLQLNLGRIHAQLEPDASLAADLNQHTIAAKSPSHGLQLGVWALADDRHLGIRSTNSWYTNQFSLNADFGPESVLPETARLRATQVVIPEKLLGKSSPTMKGSIEAVWLTNRFTLDLVGDLEAGRVRLHGVGTTNSFAVESVEITGSGVQLTNRGKFELTYRPPYLASAARLGAMIDLGQQTFFPARGQVGGEITVEAGPILRFQLGGKALQISNFVANEFSLAATADLMTGTISGGSLSIQGDTNLMIRATFEGAITNLTHAGELQVGPVEFPHVKPTSFKASWKAQHLTFDSISATAFAPDASLHLIARGDREVVRVEDLKLQQKGRTQFALEAPFQLSLKGPQFALEPMKLSGEGGKVQLAGEAVWPSRGKATVSLKDIDSELLNSFTTLTLSNIHVATAEFAGAWDRAPLEFNLAVKADWNNEIGLDADLRGDQAGVHVLRLTANNRDQALGTLTGSVPITIEPARDRLLQTRMDQPLRVAAEVQPQSHVWNLLTNYISLRGPSARATVSGTLRNPLGEFDASAAEVRFRDVTAEVPSLKDLSFHATISQSTARVDRLTFSVADQPVAFTAALPIPEDLWSELPASARKLDWRSASAQLQIKRANVAAFTPLLRGRLSPQGLIRANVALTPGGKLGGQLTIDGASTRPFPNLGAIQDIELVCEFSEQSAKVKSVGSIGGEALFAVGQVELGPEKWAKGNLPPFALEITGENVPLSRQVDSLVRGDLNVALRTRTNALPIITGNINLRNSLFLRDLRDLVPGGLASPERRPPYFSVEEAPFARWQLDLHVTGQKFLKLRTPLFNGEISADLTLTGTLKDPLAVGDVTIASGTVKLPFATLRVTQGFVTLSAENPYRPQLFINAQDRAFGYDVKMSITGAADAPVIQFSSTPPLSSEQVLLMLTAGEMPRENAFSFSAQQRAQRLAMFLGRGLISEFGLGGDASRLTVRSGEEITESGRPTYSAEYELTEKWSVIGQYDRFNDFNLMLKWQVYAR
jgi:translocation and assembly module TamB